MSIKNPHLFIFEPAQGMAETLAEAIDNDFGGCVERICLKNFHESFRALMTGDEAFDGFLINANEAPGSEGIIGRVRLIKANKTTFNKAIVVYGKSINGDEKRILEEMCVSFIIEGTPASDPKFISKKFASIVRREAVPSGKDLMSHYIEGDILGGDGQSALRRIEDRPVEERSTARIHISRIRAYRAIGNSAGALSAADEYVKTKGGLLGVLMRAQSQLKMGNKGAALKDFEDYVEKSPRDAFAVGNLAELYMEPDSATTSQERNSRALKILQVVDAQEEDRTQFLLGRIALEEGDGERASAKFDKSKKRDDAKASALNTIAMNLAKNGLYELAQIGYERALTYVVDERKKSSVHCNLALLHTRTKNRVGAITHYARSLLIACESLKLRSALARQLEEAKAARERIPQDVIDLAGMAILGFIDLGNVLDNAGE